MTTNSACRYCGAKSGHPCVGYGLKDGEVHDARRYGSTKAGDVLELGRARALLGCSSTMTLVDGVLASTSSITELRAEVDRLRAIVHGLTAELAAERREKDA